MIRFLNARGEKKAEERLFRFLNARDKRETEFSKLLSDCQYWAPSRASSHKSRLSSHWWQRSSSTPKASSDDPPSSFSSGHLYEYDVFLSFRGEDTRNGFTSHLHAALDQRGITVFMDDEELGKGEEIAPAILGAIGKSRISIVVFSENYACSSWCLDELVRIVECSDVIRQMVWPVFYKVDPSDVRKQRGRYGQALINHEERLKSDGDLEKAKRWREALTRAANISGWHLVDEHESNVIRSIVKGVWAQLDRKQLHVPENVVSMELHVSYLHTLLDMESNEVRMIGICGLGGIGKTTIAKATYNAVAHKFDYCSFLSNVRETCEKSAEGGLLQLQETLFFSVNV